MRESPSSTKHKSVTRRIKAYLKDRISFFRSAWTATQSFKLVRAWSTEQPVMSILSMGQCGVTCFGRMQVRVDPAAVLKLRCVFLKLRSGLELPLLRVDQAGDSAGAALTRYYSSALLAYVRKVLQVCLALRCGACLTCQQIHSLEGEVLLFCGSNPLLAHLSERKGRAPPSLETTWKKESIPFDMYLKLPEHCFNEQK